MNGNGVPETAAPGSANAPAIVRIAGLPLAAVQGFASKQCAAAVTFDVSLHDALNATRSEMVDVLTRAVKEATGERRHFLLKVRRDCFNGRSIRAYRMAPEWAWLSRVGQTLANRILQLEMELAGRTKAFSEEYRHVVERQTSLLLEQVGQRSFRRGLAVASPIVSHTARLLEGDGSGLSRGRRRRLEETLLRYLSRAALKLSPYSTFTRLGLAVFMADGGTLSLFGCPWSERSLVRVKRYVLDQYTAALRLYTPFRANLTTTLNSSLSKMADGRYQFLRPSQWELDRETGELTYHRHSLARARLDGPLVDWLHVELGCDSSWSYRGLVEFIRSEDGEDFGTVGDLDKLIDVGFLQLLPPWFSDEGYLEQAVLEHLRSLPQTPQLDAFITALHELVSHEMGYALCDDPTASCRAIDGLIDEAWRTVVRLAELPASPALGQPSSFNYYEDVFLEPSGQRKEDGAVLVMSRAHAQVCIRSVRPILRLSALYDHGHDFVHTLAAFASERWPGAERVNLLDLFGGIQSLWRQYTEFCLASGRTPDGWRKLFNPLRLPVLEELRDLRERVWSRTNSCLIDEADLVRISIDALQAVLREAPARYSPQTDASVFLQPADTRGELWMVNRVKEGTGRFSSRFTPVMNPQIRQRYTEHLAACGVLDFDGERVELLDVLCAQGDTANVHAPQTPKVLEMPGDACALPRSRRVRLQDLYVRIDRGNWWATLHDADGRRYLPAHLGVGHLAYLPPLVRFLCVFGPSELTPVFPAVPIAGNPDCTTRKRLVIGNLVLLRKAWMVSMKRLPAEIADLPDAQVFLAVNRWRVSQGLPERAFLVERLPDEGEGEHRRPQYVDFSSPLFVRLFLKAVARTNESLTFEEMLPTAEMFPVDELGHGWAVEILLDSLSLRQ